MLSAKHIILLSVNNPERTGQSQQKSSRYYFSEIFSQLFAYKLRLNQNDFILNKFARVGLRLACSPAKWIQMFGVKWANVILIVCAAFYDKMQIM